MLSVPSAVAGGTWQDDHLQRLKGHHVLVALGVTVELYLPNLHIEVQTPRTSECDLERGDRLKVSSNPVRLVSF